MEIALIMITLHLILYLPYYFPALERKLEQLGSKEVPSVQAFQLDTESTRTGVPYYYMGKFVRYMEI